MQTFAATIKQVKRIICSFAIDCNPAPQHAELARLIGKISTRNRLHSAPEKRAPFATLPNEEDAKTSANRRANEMKRGSALQHGFRTNNFDQAISCCVAARIFLHFPLSEKQRIGKIRTFMQSIAFLNSSKQWHALIQAASLQKPADCITRSALKPVNVDFVQQRLAGHKPGTSFVSNTFSLLTGPR